MSRMKVIQVPSTAASACDLRSLSVLFLQLYCVFSVLLEYSADESYLAISCPVILPHCFGDMKPLCIGPYAGPLQEAAGVMSGRSSL